MVTNPQFSFIKQITQKKAEQRLVKNTKLQKQSTLSEFENEYEQQQKMEKDKSQTYTNSQEFSRKSTYVQIDDVMLFFLQSNLSRDKKDLIEKIMKKMKVIENKLAQINSQLDSHSQTFQMISSLYNYALSLKSIKPEKLEQYQQWNAEFPCQIVVKSDGNCFYRSFLYKYILFIILQQNKQMLEQFISQIMNLAPLQHVSDVFPDLSDEEIKYIFILFLVKNYQKIQNRKMFSLLDLIQEYNSNPVIDLCSIVLIRNFIYQFYLKIKQSGHYLGWIQNFEKEKNHTKLIKLGQDANQEIMILSSQAFEAKVFTLTFYQNEEGKIASQINEFYLQQEDYSVSIYVLYTQDHYNILFENAFMKSYNIYFNQFFEIEDANQVLIYFDKDGSKIRQASQLLDQESLSSINEKEVIQTNFFQRLQLQDPSLFLKDSLLIDFGFKKQITAINNQSDDQQKSLWEITGEEDDEDLPLMNPFLAQQSYQMDFKTYMEMNQLSKIDSIKKKADVNDFHEISQIQKSIHERIPQMQSQKRVRVSIVIDNAEIQETPTQTGLLTLSQRSIKGILNKKSAIEIPAPPIEDQQIKGGSKHIVETISSDEESQSIQSKKEDKFILMDQRCLDCDRLTSFKEKIIVAKILKEIIICNQCVSKKAHFLQSNKLSSLSFYGVQLYRFQMLELVKLMDDMAAKSLTSIDQDNSGDDIFGDQSLELIIHKTEREIMKSSKKISKERKSNLLDKQNKCASCSRPNQEPSDLPQQKSFFIKMDNFDRSLQVTICKHCLNYYNDESINRKYLNLFKIKSTFIDPKDVINQYNKLIQEINRSGELLQCQFYCKLEGRSNNIAASLFDTDQNQLVQKKICLSCFEKILNSTMNVDNLIQMESQIQLFATIFKEDFLNDICISCNTKQLQGKKDYSIKHIQENEYPNNQNIYFRVKETTEKFDSFVCLSCIKNVLIDQYTKIPTSQDNIVGEELNTNQRQFKILYRKIGVIFNFTYSPFVNNQILKALKNESFKNQACFKCQTKTSQSIYYLNNSDNQSICQDCFILIQRQYKRSDIVNKLKISESQYMIIKEGTLQYSLIKKFCFACCCQKNQDLYHVWVKDYVRVLLLCMDCLRSSNVYSSADILELFTPFYKEKILFQSVDIPKQLLPKENQENKKKEESQKCQGDEQKGILQQNNYSKTPSNVSQQEYKPCFICQSKQKKAIKMFDCSCWLCIKCISSIVTSDNKDFMVCPTPNCIQKYQKIEVISYTDTLMKEEKRKVEQKKIEEKISRQNKSKFLCNSCKTPNIPVIITKQKYCSCVILCKECLKKIYKYKHCYKCLENTLNMNNLDIQSFDENSLCCSCLEPLDLNNSTQQQQNCQTQNVKQMQTSQLKCTNCLYLIKINNN